MKPDNRKFISEHLRDMAEKSKEEMEKHPLMKELFQFSENSQFLYRFINIDKSSLENKDIKINIEEQLLKQLEDNIELLNKKLIKEEEVMPQCSFAHNIRNFLMIFNNTISGLRKRETTLGDVSNEKMVYITKICAWLKYINFYLARIEQDQDIFQKETESKFGFVGNYDNIFRLENFSEKEKCQLSADEYLLLFYLFKKGKDLDGIKKEEFDNIIRQLEAKTKVLDIDKIKEKKKENRTGAVFLDLSGVKEEDAAAEKVIYH